MKFGGSSVADAAAIDRVASIVAAELARQRTPVVVVSALGGATDALLGLTKAAVRNDKGGVDAGLQALAERHFEVARRVAGGDSTLTPALESEFSDLRMALTSLATLGVPDDRLADRIAAAGELLSSRIVAAALSGRGIPSVWADARSAIVTDTRHTCAAPLMPETMAAAEQTVRPSLADGRVPVLGGFIGRTLAGDTTTLGRGGSDFSASLIGAAIDAAEIQIWTDVDGMLTADPRIVYDAEVVRSLSFAEAAELAYFGAKVLHPSTIFPAVSRNIPVRILNSMRPEAEGTLITADPLPGHRPFAALACKRGITVIDITSTRMLMAHGFLRRVFEAFETNETAVDVVTTSEVSVSAVETDGITAPQAPVDGKPMLCIDLVTE
jgi:aspartate kinase